MIFRTGQKRQNPPTRRSRALGFGFLVLALVACSPSSDQPRKTKAQRLQDAEAVMSTTPVARNYRIDGNELKVIEIPVSDGSGFLDLQRCYIWRDQEFKTTTMSCGQQPDVLLSN